MAVVRFQATFTDYNSLLQKIASAVFMWTHILLVARYILENIILKSKWDMKIA